MSPVELAVVGSEPDVLARVTDLVKRAAAEPLPTRAEAITRAAHGITAIIRDQQAQPIEQAPTAPVVEPEQVQTLRRLAVYLERLHEQLHPIARHSVMLPLRAWRKDIADLADELAGGAS